MVGPWIYPRPAEARLVDALADIHLVLTHGLPYVEFDDRFWVVPIRALWETS